MPEAQAQTEVRTEPEFKVTPEILAELKKNPNDIAKFPKDQRLKILAAEAQKDAPPPETPAPTPAPESDPPATPPQEEPLQNKKEDGFFKKNKRDAKYWADKNNELKQKADAEEARLTDLLKKRKEAEDGAVETPVDTLSDAHQENLSKTVQRLEKRLKVYEDLVETQAKSDLDKTKKDLASVTQNSVFETLEGLQDEFPALKTEKSIEALNREYSDFLNEITAAADLKDVPADEKQKHAFIQYQTDPEFKKRIKSQLPGEMDKLNVLLQAQNRAASQGGPVKAHLLDIMYSTGTLDKAIARQTQQSALTASQRTLKALDNSHEIKTIGPNDGSRGRPAQSPEDAARDTLRTLLQQKNDGKPWSPEQKEQNKRALQVLMA